MNSESQRIIEIYHQESYANCGSCKNKKSCINHDYHSEIAKNCKRNPNLKDNYIMDDKTFSDFKMDNKTFGINLAPLKLAEEHADFIKRWYKEVFMHGYKHGQENKLYSCKRCKHLNKAVTQDICKSCSRLPYRPDNYEVD